MTADDKIKVYGEADPPLTWQITSGSPQPGDTLTGALTRNPGEDVGSYPIRRGTLTTSANYALSFIEGTLEILDQAPEVTVGSMTWSLNFATGLFEGTLRARNNGDGSVPVDHDYWFELPVTAEWYLWNWTGGLPDGKRYFDLTAAVQTALRATGNHNDVWDPGEIITISGVVVYHRRRVNPANYVVPTSAFVEGKLFQDADSDRNFVLAAAERDAAVDAWKGGLLTDNALLDAVRLSRGSAYLWNKDERTWEILE